MTCEEEPNAAPIAGAFDHRLLRADEERRLAIRSARGDRRAREALVRSNLRLVLSVARSHRGRGATLADLVQEGVCGLLRAVDKYDVSRRVRFSTYATWWIRAAIGEALRRAQPVPLPRQLDSHRRRLAAAGATGAHEPRAEAITGLTPDELRRAQAAQELQHTVYLDDLLRDSGTRRLELHEDRSAPAPEEIAQVQLRRRDTERLLDALPHREREVLSQRFGLFGGPERTLAEVGQALGISRETVRKIERRLLESLPDLPEAQPLRDAV